METDLPEPDIFDTNLPRWEMSELTFTTVESPIFIRRERTALITMRFEREAIEMKQNLAKRRRMPQ